MQQNLQNKDGLVKNVFNKVYDKYDLMNDFMSLGIHRIWKKDLIQLMNPSKGKKLIDVACGTGDLGKLYLDSVGANQKILCVDPNKSMIKKGKSKLKKYKNIKFNIIGNEDIDNKSSISKIYLKKLHKEKIIK